MRNPFHTPFTAVFTNEVFLNTKRVAPYALMDAKVVYGLAACFYPVFIGYQFLLRELPAAFRVLLDPVGFNSESRIDPSSQSAVFLNQYVVRYSLSAYANRASMIIISALVLLLVYLRFAIESSNNRSEHFTKLPLSEIPERIAYRVPSYGLVDLRVVDKSEPLPLITSDTNMGRGEI